MVDGTNLSTSQSPPSTEEEGGGGESISFTRAAAATAAAAEAAASASPSRSCLVYPVEFDYSSESSTGGTSNIDMLIFIKMYSPV